MAKKIILKDLDNVVILPITRGELVVDSSGNQALHSIEFLATDSQPGLTKLHYVDVSTSNIELEENKKIVQLKSSKDCVYPVTVSDSVMVTTNSKTETLTDVINQIRVDVEKSIILDDRPTAGNVNHSVSSDGIYQELKETVGNIQLLLNNL